MSDYDFIIAGGGTAGCILANRLSADGKHRVLMLEAGHEARSPWIGIPAGFSKLLVDPDYNWRFSTEPEDNVHGRRIAVPRGKGVGGSTLINGMIYVRGQPADYDGWEAAGAAGWNWVQAERLFRKIEACEKGGAGRGHDGPMRLHEVSERYPVAEAFLKAAQQDGQPLNPDYNAGSQEGVGYQVLQHRGRRWSVVDGYLKPASGRPNLTVECGARITRLLFEGRRCVGLAYRGRDGEHMVRARRETLLCLGAVQSPQLLELSGVGDPALLARLGIPLAHALPQVGENYIDHYATRMNWRVKNTVTLNEMSRGWRLARQVARYALSRQGILTLGTGWRTVSSRARRSSRCPTCSSSSCTRAMPTRPSASWTAFRHDHRRGAAAANRWARSMRCRPIRWPRPPSAPTSWRRGSTATAWLAACGRRAASSRGRPCSPSWRPS